jgi:hypothetical protein
MSITGAASVYRVPKYKECAAVAKYSTLTESPGVPVKWIVPPE